MNGDAIAFAATDPKAEFRERYNKRQQGRRKHSMTRADRLDARSSMNGVNSSRARRIVDGNAALEFVWTEETDLRFSIAEDLHAAMTRMCKESRFAKDGAMEVGDLPYKQGDELTIRLDSTDYTVIVGKPYRPNERVNGFAREDDRWKVSLTFIDEMSQPVIWVTVKQLQFVVVPALVLVERSEAVLPDANIPLLPARCLPQVMTDSMKQYALAMIGVAAYGRALAAIDAGMPHAPRRDTALILAPNGGGGVTVFDEDEYMDAVAAQRRDRLAGIDDEIDGTPL